MKKILISDFSKVQLFPKDNSYQGGLNKLYDQILSTNKNFNDYFSLNEDLLDELVKLDIDKYVFTTGKVQSAPEIIDRVRTVFKDVFNVPMIGFLKTDPKAYNILCERLEVKPSQVIFIDDTKDNVEAAKEAGLMAVVYEDNNQILMAIKDWLR
ncbi:MAG: HAD-IA family hydrolase [Candidatus Pacebacteria bacterium]|jgi:HAD superfamily hydrolase (TIGR01549 family)|nr:HAD-IA family hydrolase [Candidatus Paceibacterota bacterium]MBT3511968.1 HAD-IA family hydrolase [Candidatus Paceibacterota bacterium]MBT4005290.1 HAD-IA family hydrolase [Candidatus Paceibacterota bacterium]MBT4358509.1 HAD-IA family hydrolase [Candidatus Paceibacterota bacterium]MBT4681157.1 HAD-IA family hydrolase [Candidatus Paceibacterota bacterium]